MAVMSTSVTLCLLPMAVPSSKVHVGLRQSAPSWASQVIHLPASLVNQRVPSGKFALVAITPHIVLVYSLFVLTWSASLGGYAANSERTLVHRY